MLVTGSADATLQSASVSGAAAHHAPWQDDCAAAALVLTEAHRRVVLDPIDEQPLVARSTVRRVGICLTGAMDETGLKPQN